MSLALPSNFKRKKKRGSGSGERGGERWTEKEGSQTWEWGSQTLGAQNPEQSRSCA